MSFIKFVETVLLLLGKSAIQKFFLSCSKENYGASRIQTWILSVIRRNVQSLQIIYDGENFVFPDLIYNQDSVAELKLRARSCTFRLPHSVHFSSLKILDLHWVTFHNESHSELEELHITLPALNLLTLRYCKWLNTKTVHIDALALRVFIIEEDRDWNATCQRVLKMRAPRLAKFRCRGTSSADVVFLGPSSIVDAVLGLGTLLLYEVDIRSKMRELACTLLRQFSRVKFLTLGSGTIENITLKKGEAEQGTLPQYTFPCLKVVKFNRYYGEDDELEFAKFLLKNAKVLEEMTIATIIGSKKIEKTKKRLLPFIKGSRCSLIVVAVVGDRLLEAISFSGIPSIAGGVFSGGRSEMEFPARSDNRLEFPFQDSETAGFQKAVDGQGSEYSARSHGPKGFGGKPETQIQNGDFEKSISSIDRATKAKEAWDILEDEYHGDGKNKEEVIKPREVPFEEDLQGEEEEMKMKEKDLEKEEEEAKIILIEMVMVKFLGNGCRNHMVADKNVFLDMDNTFRSHVKLGNGALVEAKGKGTISVQTNEGSRFIRDVLLVPELDQNLLSVVQLLEHGYKLDFVGDGCVIYDNGKPRKSNSGYCFSLGSGMFSCVSKKQQSDAQSSAEAEYVSASLATSQAIWLRRILEDVGEKQEGGTKLFCDNKSAIAMAKNPVYHSQTRHIAIKHHFIREAIDDGEIKLEFCRSEEQVAGIFTKVLPREKFQKFREALGVMRQHIKGENVEI
ncbi:hypothetical protein RJ640_004484 [Escallonia rubra]|uniref:FBD domain-containing protein n=1 Tax=Escallonia rubra TaxID=112253 RepID=A0AA88SN93_9ASTE|nr:hypothetical protein RJ640_004484 [Escallonia rubra]